MSGYAAAITLLALLAPALVLAWAILVRPPAIALVVVAVVAAVLEAPSIAWLVGQGGIECPTGCSDGQEVAEGLVFLGLPAAVVVALAAALVEHRRRARRV